MDVNRFSNNIEGYGAETKVSISSQTEILFYEEIMSLKSSRNLFI